MTWKYDGGINYRREIFAEIPKSTWSGSTVLYRKQRKTVRSKGRMKHIHAVAVHSISVNKVNEYLCSLTNETIIYTHQWLLFLSFLLTLPACGNPRGSQNGGPERGRDVARRERKRKCVSPIYILNVVWWLQYQFYKSPLEPFHSNMISENEYKFVCMV